MILPRRPNLALLWGRTEEPHNAIDIELTGPRPWSTSDQSDMSGEFIVELPFLTPSTIPSNLTFTETLTNGSLIIILLTNIKVGDLILCSGQSNMEMAVAGCDDWQQETAAAVNYPHMSLFDVSLDFSNVTKEDVTSLYTPQYGASWVPTSPGTVNSTRAWWYFSALCYSTGRRVYDSLNGTVPIGLIADAYGGTSVETWTSSPVVVEQCGPVAVNPGYWPDMNQHPSLVYNAMLYPLRNLRFAAVLWYQGESNDYDPERYACGFPSLINDWRENVFYQDNLPFFFVLLAAWKGSSSSNWPALRQSQLFALTLPNTGAVSAMDAGMPSNPYDIHPTNKTIIAQRMSDLVRSQVYQQPVPVAGPTISSATAVLINSTLLVQVTLHMGDAPAFSAPVILDTPGCTACCESGGLFSIRQNNTSPAVLLPTWSLESSDQFNLYVNVSDVITWESLRTIHLELEGFDYPECMLYNSLLIPANPVSMDVQLFQGDSSTGGGGGGSGGSTGGESSSTGPAPIGLWLPSAISSHMILPRGPRTATLWGKALPSYTVTVNMTGGYTGLWSTTAGADGNWLLNLPSLPVTTVSSTMVISESNGGGSVTLTDIKIGDVILCSGQSNMQMAVAGCDNWQEETAAAANYPHLRLLSPQLAANASTPLDDFTSMYPRSYGPGWVPASPSTVNSTNTWWYFSALCWSSGRRLYDRLEGKVPIGLIAAAYGGTVIESWTTPQGNAQCGAIPSQEWPPNQPSACYNAMIYPLRHIQPTAVLWYQGESNAADPVRYACAVPALINDWREVFNHPTLPFYSVLLAAFAPGGDGWAGIRQSQLAALNLPYTGVASALDAGQPSNPADVHPTNKTIIAQRLSALVSKQVYGLSVAAIGPSFSKAAAQLQTGSMNGRNVTVVTATVTMDLGDSPSTSSLYTINTPGCTSCCSGQSADGLIKIIRDSVTYSPQWSISGSTLSLLLDVTDNSTWTAGVDITIQLEWTAYPQCMLYNAALLPATPFSQVLTVTVPGGTGGESSGASNSTLLAFMIVFLIFSMFCTGCFIWQYRLRSSMTEDGARMGPSGARGLGDWWENTVGVGKRLSWKRGMSDDEVLRAVASDRYD